MSDKDDKLSQLEHNIILTGMIDAIVHKHEYAERDRKYHRMGWPFNILPNIWIRMISNFVFIGCTNMAVTGGLDDPFSLYLFVIWMWLPYVGTIWFTSIASVLFMLISLHRFSGLWPGLY